MMINKRTYKGVLVVLILLLQSCSSIQVAEYKSDSKPPEGIIYYLPSSEFDVTLKWELVVCPNDVANPDFEVKVTAGVQTSIVRDTQHTFVIGYDDLSKMSKTGKLEVNLSENGLLQSINVSAEDHSEEIISNAVSGIGKIIRVAAGIPTLEALEEEQVRLVCKEEVRTVLAAVKNLNSELKKRKNAIDQANKELAGWQKKKDSTEKKKQLAQLEKAIKKSVDEIAALKKKGKDALELVTFTKTIRLVPKAGGNIEKPVELPIATLEKWFDKYVNEEIDVNAKIETKTDLNVYVTLEGPKTKSAESEKLFLCESDNCDQVNLKNPKEQKGGVDCKDNKSYINALVYRQPVSAALMLCKGSPCVVQEEYVPFAERVYSANVPVPQYGHIATLPYSNKMFGKNSMNVEFYANGGIKKFTHEEEKSVGAGATKAFADTADQVYELQTQRLAAKSARKKEKASEKTSLLTQKNDELKAEKDVLELELEIEKARDALELYRSSD